MTYGTFSNIFTYDSFTVACNTVTYYGVRFFKHSFKKFNQVTLNLRTGIMTSNDGKVFKLHLTEEYTKHVSFSLKRKSKSLTDVEDGGIHSIRIDS